LGKILQEIKAHYALEMLSNFFSKKHLNFWYLVTISKIYTHFPFTSNILWYFCSVSNCYNYCEFVFCRKVKILFCLHFATFTTLFCMSSATFLVFKHITCSNFIIKTLLNKCFNFLKN
jgi:hypothetical protein